MSTKLLSFNNSLSRPRIDKALNESNVRYYCNKMPAVFKKASNAQIWDEHGIEYIDFLSACGSLNFGHNDLEMKTALIDYLMDNGLINGLDLQTEAKQAFLKCIQEKILKPRSLEYKIQFTGPTGTNAVEAAIKLARKVTGCEEIVAFTNAFHGMTLGSLALSGNGQARKAASVSLPNVIRLAYDGYLGADEKELERFAAMVADPSSGIKKPAGFIVETIQGEGGLNAASIKWLRKLEEISRSLGSLLIVDDIQAGCGRSGTFFSFERAGINPDIVCLSKSLSGIGLPMAVVLIKPEYDVWQSGEHNGTFRGNNLAFVTSRIALERWSDEKFQDGLRRNISTIDTWLRRSVSRLGQRKVEIRGIGLLSGLRFTQPGFGMQIAHQAFKRQLLIETSGPNNEVIKIIPPLTIEEPVLLEGLNRLSDTIDQVMNLQNQAGLIRDAA